MNLFIFYIKKYWKWCVVVLLLALINQFFSLLEPYITQRLIDTYATHFSSFTRSEFLQGVGLLVLAFVGTAFVSRVAKNFQDYYLNTITKRSGADMYREGVKHSLSLPYSIFEDERSGETLGKLQKARQDTENLMLQIVNTIFVSLIIFTFVAIYAATIYWLIPIVFLGMLFIIGTVSILMSQRIKTIQKTIVAETTALAGSTTESLRNIELVKSLGLADQEVAHLNNTTDKILQLELKKLRYLRSLDFVQGTITNAVRAGLVFFLFYLIYTKVITLGEYFSLNIYSFWLFFPLQQVAPFIAAYRETEASLANYQKLMDTAPESTPEHPKPLGTLTQFAFDKVTFGYASSEHQALLNISYQAQQGQTIAFVGPSGSGKTSLVKLLVGLYTPREGAIHYNGIRHDEISKDELRKQIGFVTQDTQLFAGTIRENMLFVNPTATDEECLAALHSAQCQNLLERGGQGLDTVIGEGGVKVSGGEKQRLSIARALLRTPSILIFDEATSALDSITEEEITKTIRDVSQGASRITVLIAHRLSTVMHADKIFVLEKGNLAETGSHDELLAEKGLYYAMWRQQIGER